MRAIERILGAVLHVAANVAGALLLVMAVMVTVDVLKRWLTGKPIIGVFEGTEMLLVAVTFLVLGLVEWQHRQLNVDVLTHRARGRLAIAFVALDKGLTVLLLGILVSVAVPEWLKAWNGWYLRRGMVEIPIVIPMGLIVAGASLTFLAALFGFAKAVRSVVAGAPFVVPDTGQVIGAAMPAPSAAEPR